MKNIVLIYSALLLGSTVVNAQSSDQELIYRRSSLSLVIIESDNFPNKQSVLKSWENYPFPDKYNAHNIATKSINLNAIELSKQDLMEAGYYKDTLKNPLQILAALKNIQNQLVYLNPEQTVAIELPGEIKSTQLKIDKVLKERQIAKQMVSTWFNMSPSGGFDMSLIQSRGSYNVSEMEASIAQGQAVGMAALADAGEQLIQNSFLTFTKLEFIENEPVARLIYDEAKKKIQTDLAGKPQLLIDQANKVALAVYEKTKEGYSLWSKTWLYKLNWNDSIANEFYTKMWTDNKAFQETDIFKMEFVGVQYNQSLVTFKLGEQRTQDQIIDLALVRNLDNAFAKLQKKNDVFKPLVPVLTSKPITAQIGMKEGLEGGEVFDVLELRMKDGKTVYTKVGTVKADKKIVWDNRYNAGESPTPQNDKNGNPITATVFKGGKAEVGMLLKLVK
jgi:hypothetical protein